MNDFPVTAFEPGSGSPIVGRGSLSPGRLKARLHDGRVIELALDRVDAKRGGASGTMIYLTSRDHGGTLTVDVPGFPLALRAAAGGALDPVLDAFRAEVRGGRRVDRVLLGIVAALALAFGAFLLMLPGLLRDSVDAIPRSVDRRIGEMALPGFVNDATLAHDPILHDAVQRIVARLEPHVPREGFVYEAHVSASPDVNAFALPGGQIVVCTGLLARAERPEAVAGVLAHELAHVTERHAVRGMVANLGLALGVRALLGQIDFLPSYAQDGALLAAMRGFSRDEELEADAVGVRTLLAANVDPRGLADVFRTLARIPGTQMPGMLAWMSTHPEHATRIARVEALTREAGPRTFAPIEGVDWPAVRAAADRVLATQPSPP